MLAAPEPPSAPSTAIKSGKLFSLFF